MVVGVSDLGVRKDLVLIAPVDSCGDEVEADVPESVDLFGEEGGENRSTFEIKIKRDPFPLPLPLSPPLSDAQ